MNKNLQNLTSKELVEGALGKYLGWLGGEHFDALEKIVKESTPAEEAEIWSRLAEYTLLRRDQAKKQINDSKKEEKKKERDEKKIAKMEAKLEKLRK